MKCEKCDKKQGKEYYSPDFEEFFHICNDCYEKLKKHLKEKK